MYYGYTPKKFATKKKNKNKKMSPKCIFGSSSNSKRETNQINSKSEIVLKRVRTKFSILTAKFRLSLKVYIFSLASFFLPNRGEKTSKNLRMQKCVGIECLKCILICFFFFFLYCLLLNNLIANIAIVYI